ncbi:sulfurtransferase TusA family protein [Reinekea sp.]|uniref:sulfurtransferase TusA family protein n=1 Tax=Reinekea sp. TaxID=1970455 RepID=UPI0039893829
MSCKTTPDQTLDARGLRCPLPLLKLKQSLSSLVVGDCIEVLATDAGAMRDIPAFIKLTAHTLHEHQARDNEYYFLIEKGQ